MDLKTSVVSRISQWFKPSRSGDDLPPLVDQPAVSAEPSAPADAIERAEPRPRLSFLRPWARRDAAIAGLQQGFTTLNELMSTIRDNLEKQAARQDEMLSYMANLPEILQALPESQRTQNETLQVMSQQLQQQIAQQGRLADILDKVSESGAGQKQILQALNGRVENLSQHDQAIAENLRHVGTAVEQVGRTSQSSAEVFQQFRQSLAARDLDMQELLQRQGDRTTTLIYVAIGLSAAAIIVVSVVGLVLLLR